MIEEVIKHMYQIDTLYNVDCIKFMEGGVQDKCIDLTVTDIPYAVVNRKTNGLRNMNKGIADEQTFCLEEFMSNILRVTKGSCYIFCASEQLSYIRKAMVDAGMTTRLIIWEKTNPSPMNGQYVWLSGVECCVYGKFKGAVFNGFCDNTVLRYPCGRNKIHPTQKPSALIAELIEKSSNIGDIVFDPCMGSGTTCVEAKRLGRHYIGCEISKEYFDKAYERVSLQNIQCN